MTTLSEFYAKVNGIINLFDLTVEIKAETKLAAKELEDKRNWKFMESLVAPFSMASGSHTFGPAVKRVHVIFSVVNGERIFYPAFDLGGEFDLDLTPPQAFYSIGKPPTITTNFDASILPAGQLFNAVVFSYSDMSVDSSTPPVLDNLESPLLYLTLMRMTPHVKDPEFFSINQPLLLDALNLAELGDDELSFGASAESLRMEIN